MLNKFRGLLCILPAVSMSIASACEIRVRDAAFRMPRDVHRLCVIGESTDQAVDEIHNRLRRQIEAVSDTLNVELARVHVDDPKVQWHTLGIPSAPPLLPVTVLVGRNNGDGTNFVVQHWEPAPTDEDLAALIESPLRAELARQLTKNVAVLIFASRESNENSERIRLLQKLVGRGVEAERVGLALLTLDRFDPTERLLAAFMGLRPDAPDTLIVAFGRGKLMQPPLVAEEITPENIDALLHTIRQACSCSKPLPTMGVDLPLVWTNDLDQSVVLMDEELENESEADLDLAVASLGAFGGHGITPPSAGQEAEESSIQPEPPIAAAPTRNTNPATTAGQPRLMTTTVFAVFGLALAVLVASIAILRKPVH